jgi:ArsR family transcriptional regulator, arsenate/arsenite/antimonite-responsive transcriptional repressor
MDTLRPLIVLEALAQKTRFNVVELLLDHEPNGLSSGDVARELDVPQNTMSAHLRTLTHAGLIRPERHSRHVIYRADREYVMSTLSALVEHFSHRSLSRFSGEGKGHIS